MNNALLSFAKNNAALLLVVTALFSIGIRLDPLARSMVMENRCIDAEIERLQLRTDYKNWEWRQFYARAQDTCRQPR